MYAAVFRDATGKEIFRIQDNSLTIVPVGKGEAILSAMKAFNDAVRNGQISWQIANSWTHLDVFHADGSDRVRRAEAEEIFYSSATFDSPNRSPPIRFPDAIIIGKG